LPTKRPRQPTAEGAPRKSDPASDAAGRSQAHRPTTRAKPGEALRQRRFGAKTSATRLRLIQAGIEVLQDEGATAFTARRVAEQAGLKPQLVHYYFRTIEDLVLAIMQHWGTESLRRALRAADSAQPLREIWRATLSDRSASLVAAVLALAQNNEAILAEAYRQLEQYRILMSEALERDLQRRNIKTTTSGMAIVMIMDALARLLVSERAFGFSLGHEELTGLIEAWLDGYYGGNEDGASG
jgi:AcrR family transcriptional regulator